MFKLRNTGWAACLLISVSPIFIWLFLQPISNRISNPNDLGISVAELLSLVGTTMFSISFVLSLRPKILEDFFGGMDRIYIAHHAFGAFAFILLMLHPLALAASLLPYSIRSAAQYILPGDDWAINLGIASLLLMMGLLVLTFFGSLRYDIWRFSHKFLGLAFFIGVFHGFFVPSDISRSPAMAYYMFVICLIGGVSYVYKTLLGRFFIRPYVYMVSLVKAMDETTIEVSLSPQGRQIPILPGQFVFLHFKSKNISSEVHPFSVCSRINNDTLIFGVKVEGDYTLAMKNLEVGAFAYLEGPYGRFLYEKAKSKKQVWIAGGIGITPFIDMGQSLGGDYDVDMYYVVKEDPEAVYLAELQQISLRNAKFKVHPYFSGAQGRFTADFIEKVSKELKGKDYFVCGPPPMMHSLKKQLQGKGVPSDSIHSEEFNLL